MDEVGIVIVFNAQPDLSPKEMLRPSRHRTWLERRNAATMDTRVSSTLLLVLPLIVGRQSQSRSA